MKSFHLIILATVLLLGGVGWFEFSTLKNQKVSPPEKNYETEVPSQPELPKSEVEKTDSEQEASFTAAPESTEYPKVTTEVKNGRTERTIHMGVRQWAWEPSTLRVKQGELVRLVIHNADVSHPLYIPELGIEAQVPPEGAVVEFEATKKGNFFFLCGTYCGEGHAEMQGNLIVE